ncbi:MAG: 50S ribosomal protein L32 [Patescibacteria group bacterium]
MAVPKKRPAKSKRNSRRRHHFLTAAHFTSCPRCSTPIPGHTACPNCGFYRGREVIDVTKKLAKKDRRDKEKARSQQ